MKIRSRPFYILAFMATFSVCGFGAEDKPANIILILTDNLNPDLLGPYGNTEIRTPNLDRMAQGGLTFDRAFSVSGVCSPTRATLLTGLLPSQTGVHNALPSVFSVENWSAIEEFRNLPQTLSDAGYATGLIGKYHLGQPDHAQLGFDEWVTFPSGHTNSFYGATIIDNEQSYWEEDTHLTDFWTAKAEEFIRQNAGRTQPFFLFLSYNGPYNIAPVVLNPPNNRHVPYYEKHVPGTPQEPLHPFIKNLVIDAILDNREALKGWRIDEETGGREGRKLVWSDLAWQVAESLNNRTAMINVGSEVSMVDDGVGRILATLEESGLTEETLVIFSSDQGAAYGQHGLWGNSSQAKPVVAYDENMQIPFIARHPGKITPGRRANEMISLYDVLPTLLDYTGLDNLSVSNTPGTSFHDVLIGNQVEWKNEVFFEYILTRAIRTPEWKYVKRFLRTPDELYHLTEDPDENRNLITDMNYGDTIAGLDKRLSDFFDAYADPEYNVWKGGTAKAVLMYGGRNEPFEEHFPGWKKPFVKKADSIFRD